MKQWPISKQSIGDLVKALLVFLIIMIAGSAVVTLCISNEYMDITKCKYTTPFICLAGSLAGTYIAGKGRNADQIYLIVFTPVVLFVAMLLLGVFMFNGMDGGSVLWGFIAFIIGGGAGIWLRLRPAKRTHRRKRR